MTRDPDELDRLLERMERELERWDKAGLGALGGVSRDIKTLIKRVKEAEREAEKLRRENNTIRQASVDAYTEAGEPVFPRGWTPIDGGRLAELEDAEARLRVAEEVLRVVRVTVDQAEPSERWTLADIENALRHYDEAVARVTRVKEGREQGTYPNICGALPSTPRKGYCTLLPRHSGLHDSGYGFAYETSSRGYIQEAVKE